MVQCTGPIYNFTDYASLNEKLNHAELVKLNADVDQLTQPAPLRRTPSTNKRKG